MNIPRYWRAQSQRYSLAGEICKQCGARLFPPRDICPECRELALEPLLSILTMKSILSSLRKSVERGCLKLWG
jgi:ribosomal protein L40E